MVFGAHGTVMGSLAARIPWIAAHVGVGVGELSIALLMPGVGAMLAMPFSGRIVHRFPMKPLMGALMTCWAAALILPSLPKNLALLCVVLLPYGAAAGISDNAMNAHAVAVEGHYGRSVMSSFHGLWSTGALLGSAGAALSSRFGLGAQLEFVITAACLVVISLLATRWFIQTPAPQGSDKPPAFALPTRPVLLIGLVGLCAVFGEQSSTDWSALFFRRQLGTSLSLAALAVTAYSAAMAGTRLLGDHAIRRAGPVTMVRAAGLLAGAGGLLVVLAHQVVLGVIGFALLGVGVAVVVPLVFAAAGRVGPHPARSIAGVAGVSYGAGLVAPGVIGGIASASSLRLSFAVVAVLVAFMALTAGVVAPAADPVPGSPDMRPAEQPT